MLELPSKRDTIESVNKGLFNYCLVWETKFLVCVLFVFVFAPFSCFAQVLSPASVRSKYCCKDERKKKMPVFLSEKKKGEMKKLLKKDKTNSQIDTGFLFIVFCCHFFSLFLFLSITGYLSVLFRVFYKVIYRMG